MIKLMELFPWIVALGADWIAGESFANDHVLLAYTTQWPVLPYIAGALGTALVLLLGFWHKQHRA